MGGQTSEKSFLMALPTLKMPDVKKAFVEGGFLINVGTMMGGNITAQGISVLVAPIITRLYSADEFGIMTLLGSIITVCSMFACLEYQTAIVLPREGSKAINLVALCFLCTCVVIGLIIIVLLFSSSLFATLADADGQRLQGLLWLIPVGVLCQGVVQNASWFYVRRQKYQLLSITPILNSSSIASVKIVLCLLFGSSATWLIMGNISGPLCVMTIMGVIFLLRYRNEFLKGVSKQEIMDVAREYSLFPKYKLPTAVMNSMSQNIPVFLFAYFFSEEVVGYYGLANSLLRRPIILVSQSLSKVFLQRIAQSEAIGKGVKNDFIRTTTGLIGVGIIPFGALMMGGGWLFSFVFGKDWATAGSYAQLLAPWLFFGFINPPATQVIQVKQKLRFSFYYNLAAIILRVTAILVGCQLSGEPWVGIGLFSGVGVFLNIFYISYAFILARR
jgi:O-antigen/teichoic acid export membrane protein